MDVREVLIALPSAILAEIRLGAIAIAMEAWPELGGDVARALPEPLDPIYLLPIATGRSCGAPVEVLAPTVAAVLLQGLCYTLLDAVADDDQADGWHRSWGVGRTIHVAGALQLAATRAILSLPLARESLQELVSGFMQSGLRVYEGQVRELAGQVQDLRDYERLVALKTAEAFRYLAATGAFCADASREIRIQVESAGCAVGRMVQLLDDLESFWHPDGPTELSRGWFTYPLWVGLSLAEHPSHAELRQRCEGPISEADEQRIREILEAMGVRMLLMERALAERDAALTALEGLHPDGHALLKLTFDFILRDWRRLLGVDKSPANLHL